MITLLALLAEFDHRLCWWCFAQLSRCLLGVLVLHGFQSRVDGSAGAFEGTGTRWT